MCGSIEASAYTYFSMYAYLLYAMFVLDTSRDYRFTSYSFSIAIYVNFFLFCHVID